MRHSTKSLMLILQAIEMRAATPRTYTLSKGTHDAAPPFTRRAGAARPEAEMVHPAQSARVTGNVHATGRSEPRQRSARSRRGGVAPSRPIIRPLERPAGEPRAVGKALGMPLPDVGEGPGLVLPASPQGEDQLMLRTGEATQDLRRGVEGLLSRVVPRANEPAGGGEGEGAHAPRRASHRRS